MEATFVTNAATHPLTGHPDQLEAELPLFSAGQGAAFAERARDLDAFWLPRHARLPFYTLGATNYYDITANPARPYERLARQYNPLLRECFAQLYDTLVAGLAEHLRRPVTFLAGSALPGFHIFDGHPEFAPRAEHDVLHRVWFTRRDGPEFPGNPIHVDTAHGALDLANVSVPNLPPTLSFTLPLGLPREGAGMALWPLGVADLAHLDGASQLERLRASPTRFVAYRPGTLFLHSGTCYHQARGLPVTPGDHRITLQGHGIWIDGAWRLFW
ncbi:hypothetical protein GWC77_16215 [Paraburkholderia sp. NMBU_R16]|uniref:hypothetical protein n=1 Tax=Paraburkholderia sp. NMBU_R16 TaxID=2698676 RepID=UPI001563619D|nr:hypothetical protein [Paraburkholderia sp. NMBU_R16]NRO97469.1 hypothetical protein [Paraburkholderia sp. NMBU_R16]